MQLSVIIPAHNAAETLAETLDSLLAQTSPDWEAIVVDDGSADETAGVASDYAARDPRIRLVSQAQAGESGARNTGIGLARYDWFLFLDADDWLLPLYLERAAARLEADSNLDAVMCGWTRVAPDGRLSDDKYCPQPENVFELSTKYCPFAIHACVVRRSLVESAGTFDTSLRTCADWDFWQRIARQGARFGMIPEVLARYRMRPGSAGVNGPQLLRDGLRVIRQGHSSDSRLTRPAPEYAHGTPRDLLPRAEYHYCCWAAGLMIGGGHDATSLLESFTRPESDLDPHRIALILFEAILLPACRLPSDWPSIWPAYERLLDLFLQGLEAKSLAPGIALRSRRELERLVLRRSVTRSPLAIGRAYRVKIEAVEPIPDVWPPKPADRLICEVEVEGTRLGSFELPVCDGFVPAYVLADAMVARFAWPILGRFWRKTFYRQFQVKQDPDGISIWREGSCLARGLPEEEESLWQQAHDRIGWAIFSEQLWKVVGDGSRQRAEDGWFLAEASDQVPGVEVIGDRLVCLPTVGGVPLGAVTVPVDGWFVPADQLRSALLEAVGFESCRVAVREGLLGRSFQAPASLWERLRIAADQRRRDSDAGTRESLFPPALSQALRPDQGTIVLGPRLSDPIATSASRRAVLPAEAASEILEAVSGSQQVYCEPPARLLCAPDLVPFKDHRLQAEVWGWGQFLPGRTRSVFNILNRIKLRRPAVPLEDGVLTSRLPILMYHRVAPTGDPRTSRFRMTPDAFEEQLHYLYEAGYRSVSLEEWRLAMKDERPLPGRAVLMTFDDGYLDFETYAWPLLRRYSFSATLFVVTEDVGKTNRWDHRRAEELCLLDWTQLRCLQSQGLEIGSHSASHPSFSDLTPGEIVREAARSRAILQRQLERPVKAFAYPYGIHDEAIQHLVGACGYIFGLSCEYSLSGFFDRLLALPRIEITGSDTLPDFVRKIGGGQA